MFSGSWKTTVIGILAGIATYIAALGPNLPTDAKGWAAVFVAALISALGMAAKDSNVSNSPTPLAQSKPVPEPPKP